MSAAEQRWHALMTDALAASAGENTAELETILLLIVRAAAPPYGLSATEVNGLPPGNPHKLTVRAASRRLLEWPLEPKDSRSRRRHAVALLGEWDSPQRLPETDDPMSEIRSRTASAQKAYKLGRRERDQDLILMAGRNTLRALYVEHDWPAATEVAEQVLSSLVQPHLEINGDDLGLWQELLPDAPDNIARWSWRLQLRYKLLSQLESLSQVYHGANWDDRLPTEAASIGRELAEERPNVYAMAVAMRARYARRTGDSRAFRRIEKSLTEWIGDKPSHSMLGVLFTMRMLNASALNDYAGRREFASRGIANKLDQAGVSYADARDVRAAEVLPAIEWAVERGLGEYLRQLGNAAYQSGSSIVLAGLIEDDLDGTGNAWADEANAWLDICERSWSAFGNNGFVAIDYGRIRNEWRRPGRPNIRPEDATTQLLTLLPEATRGGLRRKISTLVVKSCEPGDERVAAALRGVIANTSSRTDRGVLTVSLAKFLAKATTVAPEDERAELWADVEEIAYNAAQNHLIADIYLSPQSACDGYALAAEARLAHGDANDRATVGVALEYYVQAIHCLSFALLNLASEGDRRRLRRKNTPMLLGAANAAALLGDTKAADLIMEAIRRERVGLILGELSRDPNISEQVREHAENVRASTLAAPIIDDEADEVNAEGLGARSGESQAEVREHAIDQAESVLGPLAAAVRMPYGRAVVARSVLLQSEASTGRADAVLQLVRLTTDGAHATFVRQATWYEGDDLREHIDVVDVPSALVSASPSRAGYFSMLPQLADAYLPEPLREFLLDTDAPVRLMIIPTGAQSVPFEALPLSDTVQLIDRAIVTMHTSLTTIRSLLEIHERPSHVRSTVVYDLQGLEHTAGELGAIIDSHQVDFNVLSKAELADALDVEKGVPGGILAMGVHGSSSSNGWGQTKTLPDGSSLIPADFMGRGVPRLCVLASCHSSIESSDGAELSGFPLAMFLSGATTVIGSLLAVPDKPTSEIMSIFWRELAVDDDPVNALWRAKHEWFTHRPANAVSHRSWAGIVVYGGAHY